MTNSDDAANSLPDCEPFSEERYYAAYKRIKYMARHYAPLELVSQIAEYINSGNDEHEKLMRQPWLGVLLIKWTLLDDNFDHPGRRPPRADEVQRLMQSMFDLAVKTRLPDNFEHFILFFRAIAQQQFNYQTAFSAPSFARQFVLFGYLESSHRLRQQFAADTGLELPEFFELAVALMTRFLTKPFLFVEPQWFSPLKIPDVETKSKIFLDFLGPTPKKLREKLLKSEGKKRPAREYFELTPLTETPLININGRYWTFHPAILHRKLEHFVHDHFRAKDPGGFMQSFGRIFEQHVRSLIARTGLPVTNEDDLNRMRNHKGQPVDFLITDGDAHIFVDAKGVVNSNRVMTTHLAQIIRGGLKDSALKAIRQALDVQRWLQGASDLPDALKPRDKNYLVVVTYKALHLGNGTTFRDAIAEADVNEMYQQVEGYDSLPLKNIYFMSVEEFDLLCHAVAASKIRFSEAIDQARRADEGLSSRRFEFRQHMRDWPFFEELRNAAQVPFNDEMDKYAVKYKNV